MPLLTIGHDKEAVHAFGDFILSIIQTDNSDMVKTAALDTFRDGVRIENVRIDHCVFNGDGTQTTAELPEG